MMKIYNILFLLFFIFKSAFADSNRYIYSNDIVTFEIKENENYYEVFCFENTNTTIRYLEEKSYKYRLIALDLIGTYIVFKNDYLSNSNPKYFQIFVDGISLQYKATVKAVKHDYRVINGRTILCYICSKDKYNIKDISYNRHWDLLDIIEMGYRRKKNEKYATLFYEYRKFDSKHYIQLQEDFHKSNAIIPPNFSLLQQIRDRFERSIYAENDEYLKDILKRVVNEKSETEPYNRFCLEELVTSSPVSKKKEYYEEWKESMRLARTVWEDALYYCSEEINTKIDKNNLCFSNAISAFCGAIIPYGIRQPITDEMYRKAANAYSKSDFEQSVEILKESIDTEGISPSTLNLLGASYRFLNKPKEALPFLILCFRLNPKTQYLVGNIALCYQMIDYPQMEELCNFLMNYAVDDWSKNEITKLMKQ